MKRWIMFAPVLLGLLMTGCVTQIHGPEEPPLPTQVLRDFTQFELTPLSINPAYDDSSANKRAKRKIEDNLYVEHLKSFPRLQRVRKGEPVKKRKGVLRIEPHIEAIKFVSGASRVFAGSLSGSSAVRLVVKYRDMETGQVIAEPLFYSRANATGGEWSMGATDNMMLLRIARDIAKYSANLNGREYDYD